MTPQYPPKKQSYQILRSGTKKIRGVDQDEKYFKQIQQQQLKAMFASRIVRSFLAAIRLKAKVPPYEYKPTPYLRHHFLQSLYELFAPRVKIQFDREKIFFVDGGHITLDWVNRKAADQGKPIVLIMHGMTGGSETNYMKILAKKGAEEGYTCVCFNSRGINSKLSSPIPFTAYGFHELQTVIRRLHSHYPKTELYFIGVSWGCNYLLRYILQHPTITNLKGLVLLCTPFDVSYAMNRMNKYYQKFFTKYYIEKSVLAQEQMKFWFEKGVINYDRMMQAKNLVEFHDRVSAPLLGYPDAETLFLHYKIEGEQIKKLEVRTLMLSARDDPMVGFQSLPVDAIKQNKNIKLLLTQKGGHICWYEGWKPQRWYPTPTFHFISELHQGKQFEE